jgi:hypothetical protein
MAVALWVVGGVFVVVFFGTWALQIALWLLAVALRLAGWVAIALFGLMSLLALAVIDRRQLARIWRNQRAQAGAEALLRRERQA